MVTNQEPRKTIDYCLENNGCYCFPHPRWRLEKSEQSGVKLKTQGGGVHESRPCWKTAHQPQQRTWNASHRFPWRHKPSQSHAINDLLLSSKSIITVSCGPIKRPWWTQRQLGQRFDYRELSLRIMGQWLQRYFIRELIDDISLYQGMPIYLAFMLCF